MPANSLLGICICMKYYQQSRDVSKCRVVCRLYIIVMPFKMWVLSILGVW